ncbi:MAG TPA: ABC transporter substrate-binding protein [Stellaceae bacterium]|nr:ABC transporter substrate-binding protein [Stellaceae bacterium]
MNGNEKIKGDEKTEDVSRRRLQGIAGGAAFLALSLAPAGFALWATPAEASATLPTVTIGKAVDTIPFTVVDVALAEGYFKQNGVDVEEELVHGSSAANAAMIGGSLQFACEAANPLMLARSHGVPIMSVDAVDDGVGLQVLVSTEWLAKHPISADATFKQRMADLNGAILAEVGTTEQSFFGLLRGWAGLPPSSGYKVEKIDSLAAISLAIQKGIVDISIQSPPHSFQLTQQGYAKDFADRRNVKQFNNVAYDILTTTPAYAQAHPQITTDVATSIAQALNFMRNHPKQTLALEEKHFATLSAAVLQESLEFIPFAKDGMQSRKGWENAVELAQQTGLIKDVKSTPEGVYWTNKYIDRSKLDR